MKHIKHDGGLLVNIESSFDSLILNRNMDTRGKPSMRVAIVICMGNDAFYKTKKKGKQLRVNLEPGPVNTARQLAEKLAKNYDACIMLIGGSAQLWKLDERYNLMMQQLRAAAREAGVLVLSGSQLYWSVMLATHGDTSDAAIRDILPDQWHPKHTNVNKQHMARYISRCAFLVMALRVELTGRPVNMIISAEEYKQIRARIEE